MTKWKTLKSEKDYKAAVKRIDELIDAERTDAVFNELNLVAMLVEQYEAEHYPMPDASPLEVVKFMMEMKDIIILMPTNPSHKSHTVSVLYF